MNSELQTMNSETADGENNDFISCFENNPYILTEGAVGLRLIHEFGVSPDENIRFASVIYDKAGRKALETIYGQYLRIAESFSLPILLTTNTRRVNRETVSVSSYKEKEIISDYTDFLRELAGRYNCKAYIGGAIGCKGDAYKGTDSLSAEEAADFHKWQIDKLAEAKVDFIFESIMPVLSEIIGISVLAENTGIPYIVSLMIRRNGKIIDGHTVHEAISETDKAVKRKPLCYMTNCVHPDILREALSNSFNETDTVKTRFKGIQANAACADPEELESLHSIKSSTADELANSFKQLETCLPLKICGGCCGTDNMHIEKIASYLKNKN